MPGDHHLRGLAPDGNHYRDGGFAYYECSSKADLLSTPACRSITAETVDNAVAERLLDALDPHEVALTLAAADEIADRRHRRSRAAELAVERARYEAGRAERAFHACEPENRLVARNLESRWETCLGRLGRSRKGISQGPVGHPVAAIARSSWKPSRLMSPACGTRPRTSPRDRKRLLRTLVADITMLPEPDMGKARIGVRWHTGATDELVVGRVPESQTMGPHRSRPLSRWSGASRT